MSTNRSMKHLEHDNKHDTSASSCAARLVLITTHRQAIFVQASVPASSSLHAHVIPSLPKMKIQASFVGCAIVTSCASNDSYQWPNTTATATINTTPSFTPFFPTPSPTSTTTVDDLPTDSPSDCGPEGPDQDLIKNGGFNEAFFNWNISQSREVVAGLGRGSTVDVSNDAGLYVSCLHTFTPSSLGPWS